MLTNIPLVAQLRPLIHPMLVHFPIALLFASVALDWIGYWLKHPNLTRAGFYTLVLGAFSSGIAALSGPDHATGDPSVPALLAAHQTWAGVTVALAVALVAMRFFTARGLSGGWALLYLAATLALLATVSLTGYYGGEMTYHHAVGVTVSNAPVATSLGGDASSVRPLIPAKAVTALIGMLAILAFGMWIALGRQLFPRYFTSWWGAVRQERAQTGSRLWTLWRGRERLAAPKTGMRTAYAPTGWAQPGPQGQQKVQPDIWSGGPPTANGWDGDQSRTPTFRR